MSLSSFQASIPFLRGMVITVFSVITLHAPLCSAQESFRLNSTSAEPLTTKEKDGFLDRIAMEISSRIGMKGSMTRLPGERSLLNVNQGIDDGTLIRVGGLEEVYPNLVQVREKIKDNEFVVFSKKTDFTVTGWESLKPYNVAFINGWKIMEENVREARSIIKVRNAEELFSLLEKNRVDIILLEKTTGLYFIQSKGLKNVRMLTPPLAKREMFMYLNEKHRALVPDIEAAIRGIKQDGTYQEIMEHTLGKLTPGEAGGFEDNEEN
ncbi:MAG TPA: transporter substrate-binding domain-containing protein [Nitrospiria bacterium]